MHKPIAPSDLRRIPDLKPGARQVSAGQSAAVKRAIETAQRVSASGATGLVVDHDGVMQRTIRQEVPSLTHFRVQAEHADYVVARKVITGGIDDTDVLLAKPPYLRESSRPDAISLPKYHLPAGEFLGAFVLATRDISNGTRVTVDGTPLMWQIHTVDVIPPAHKTVTDEVDGHVDVQPVRMDGTTAGATESWGVLPEPE